MPDGYSNPPHYHAHLEYITVMQGTLLFGTGDEIDKSKARVLPAGFFLHNPRTLRRLSFRPFEKPASCEDIRHRLFDSGDSRRRKFRV